MVPLIHRLAGSRAAARPRFPAAFRAAALALALASSGCVLAPRPDPVADDVFRDASGAPVVQLPSDWAWARPHHSTPQPFNRSTVQPFNPSTGSEAP